MQLSLVFAVVGGIGMVLLLNLAILSRQSGEDVFDSHTLRRIQALLVDCQPEPCEHSSSNVSSPPVVSSPVSCPPPINASAEVLAQARLIMELKQNDFQMLRNEYAAMVKSKEEQNVGFQMALEELKF
jgi:hypothetical protein